MPGRNTRSSTSSSKKSDSSIMADSSVADSLKSIQKQMDNMNHSLTSSTGEVSIIRSEIDNFVGIKDSLEFTQKQLTETKEDFMKLKNPVQNQAKSIDIISEKLNASRKENTILKENLLKLDTYIRRENLKFSGISESNKESASECKRKLLEVFCDTLKISNTDQIKFQRCHRLGPRSKQPGRDRDIIADLFGLKIVRMYGIQEIS